MGLRERRKTSWRTMGNWEDAMADNWALNADFLVNMSASADVLAQAKVEIDLAAIPLGKNVCFSLPLSLSLRTAAM